jgi:ATP-dependent RNA helicase DDX42
VAAFSKKKKATGNKITFFPPSSFQIFYDNEGNPQRQKREVDPLGPIDHLTIAYADFNKDFYEPHTDIAAMSPADINALRLKLGLNVKGKN